MTDKQCTFRCMVAVCGTMKRPEELKLWKNVYETQELHISKTNVMHTENSIKSCIDLSRYTEHAMSMSVEIHFCIDNVHMYFKVDVICLSKETLLLDTKQLICK